MSTASELADRVAERDQVVLAQGPAGLDHVGDGVGDAQLHRDLDRAVQPDHVGADAVPGQVSRTRRG